MTSLRIMEALAALLATTYADLRWLRVAQREHYLPGAVSIFVKRWWYGMPFNLALWVVGLLGLMMSAVFHPMLFLTAVIVAIGPLGLTLKGRTSPLSWTRRMKTLAAVVVTLQLLVVLLALGAGLFAPVAVVIALLAPTFVEVGLVITRPWEKKKANAFVDQARKRLASVSPKVVAITGSYGKTSTKVAVGHLLESSKTVFATPASFNNRAGLSRAINEQLSPGTDVFVAEMGTYGRGEIAELCEMCPPNIAVLTAVGPVHLERFGSEAAIIAAKSEIFELAETAVVNVGDERLAKVANDLEAAGKRVWRCSDGSVTADVCVQTSDGRAVVRHGEQRIADLPEISVAPSNAACAVAVALESGCSAEDIASRMASLPPVSHRQETNVSPEGITVIDDTYNANPASVRSALHRLAATKSSRRVVVTPGMVELGGRQFSENESFAGECATSATDLVIVGRTNLKALLVGAKGSELKVVTVPTLPSAVAWVRNHVQSGDSVLYVNDLPDHYP